MVAVLLIAILYTHSTEVHISTRNM